MEAAAIYERLKGLFGDSVLEFKEVNGDPFVVVESSRIADIARHLKEEQELCFDSLICLSAVDSADRYSVVYHLYSLKQRHRLVVKAHVAKDTPHLPSVQSVWRAANWHEREGAELFGVVFQGHPNPKPLLLWEGFEGYPLRKDYPFYDYFAEEGIPAPQH